MAAAAILDVDGTLVDTNYQHAIAWYRAFRKHDIVLPVWRIHRHVGMGGDQLVEALTDEDTENNHGDSIRDAEKETQCPDIAAESVSGGELVHPPPPGELVHPPTTGGLGWRPATPTTRGDIDAPAR